MQSEKAKARSKDRDAEEKKKICAIKKKDKMWGDIFKLNMLLL